MCLPFFLLLAASSPEFPKQSCEDNQSCSNCSMWCLDTKKIKKVSLSQESSSTLPVFAWNHESESVLCGCEGSRAIANREDRRWKPHQLPNAVMVIPSDPWLPVNLTLFQHASPYTHYLWHFMAQGTPTETGAPEKEGHGAKSLPGISSPQHI